MSLFVEVFSVEKDCPVILNLDSVIEIAPLKDGCTAIFYADTAAVGGKTAVKVKDSYNLFKQFVVQPVTPEDIARRFPKVVKEEAPALPEPKTAAAKKVEAIKAQNKTGSQGPGTTTANLG